MTPQQLAALGEITRKAIADAVEPLAARIKELEGRPAYDPQPHAEASAAVLRSIGQINERIDTVAKSIPAPYDDSGLVDRLSKQLEALREQIPAAYDDTAMKSAFSEQGKRVAAVVDGVQAVKDRIEEVAKSVPAAYDDTALRNEMDVLLKGVDAQLDHLRKQAPADGKPGADGRDALQLEVLPAIDEQKSYTRGTYAKHAGGLWRSFEQTSGMRGWECIVDGIADVVISPSEEDPRVVGVEVKRASGASDAVVIAVPAMVYKGVFKSESGDGYAIGDTVTWAGSLWHCNVTGTKALPGDRSADWTLAVKKGRDGREVVKTERAQGPVKIGGAE